MDTAILILISVTLLVILGSVYLEIRRQIKPNLKIYFPDGSTKISYRAKEEASVAIHIKNIGKLGLPKPVARNIAAFVYSTPTFLLKQFKWGSISITQVNQASAGGIFGGMQYMSVKAPCILFHGEEEVITIVMQMPENTGNYSVKVAISSDEGDLGIHDLKIIVS